MKNLKLFSLFTVIAFLTFQSCEKIKEALVITVNVPIEKCHTIMAPVPTSASEGYSQEIEITNTKTQEVLEDNDVDASAIKSASPNELVISIGNPAETNFKVTDVKSIKVELTAANKATIKLIEEAIENATVTDNQAIFKADESVEIDVAEYLKVDKMTMKVTIFTSADVNEDTELCFNLKNNMKIGLPE